MPAHPNCRSPVVVVRRVTENDWSDLRAVRLAALVDSPAAFGSTLEREQAYDEADWRSWLSTAVVFIGFTQDGPVGMVAGIEGETAHERHLVAMWVDPEHRGHGLGSSLVDQVVQWAREQGARRLVLWVADGNDAALHLYRRHGFAESGKSKPLPSNPTINEEQLLLRLAHGG
jgi:ribosomal protein S18 acetylase RimI-like enzyme